MGIRTRNQRPQRYELSDFSRGMIRDIDQGDFPKNSLKTIQNMRITQTGGLTRRYGHIAYAASMGASPVEALKNVRLSAADTLFAVSGNLKKLSAGAFVDTDLTGLDSGRYYCLKGMETKQTGGTALKTGPCTDGSTERIIRDIGGFMEKDGANRSVAASNSYYGSVCDSSGNLYVVYGPWDNLQIRKYAPDGTVAWTSQVTTDYQGFCCIALDNTETPVVAWDYSINSPEYEEGGKYARFSKETGSRGSVIAYQYGADMSGTMFNTIAIRQSDNAKFFSWIDGYGAFKLTAFDSNNSRIFGPLTIVSGAGNGVNHSSLSIGSDGHLWMLYRNGTNLILSKRNGSTGAVMGTDTTIHSGGATRTNAVLADDKGALWCLWIDDDNGDIGKFKVLSASDRSVVHEMTVYTEPGKRQYLDVGMVSAWPDGDGGIWYGYTDMSAPFQGMMIHITAEGIVDRRNPVDLSGGNLARLSYKNSFWYMTWLSADNASLISQKWRASTELPDAYLGKVLEMTSGKAQGNRRIITASEPGAIYLTGMLDEAPEAGDTYAIYDVTPHLFICGGATAPGNGIYLHKHDGTTKTAFTDYHPDDMEVHAGRLFAAFGNILRFSEAGLGEEFSRNNWIKVSTAGDNIQRIVAASENQLIIYLADSVSILSGTSPTDFSLAPFTGAPGLRAKKSVAIGGKLQFYLSRRGVELLNTLATNSLAQQLPLSEPIKSLLSAENSSDLDNAVGWVFDNKYFLQVGKRRYIYDIYQSARTGKPVWLTDLLADAAAECQARCALDWNGTLIVGSNTAGYTFTTEAAPATLSPHNLSDNGDAYPVLIESHMLDMGTPAKKLIDRVIMNWSWTGADANMTLSLAPDLLSAMADVGAYGVSSASGINKIYRRRCERIAWKVSGDMPMVVGAILPAAYVVVRNQSFLTFEYYPIE